MSSQPLTHGWPGFARVSGEEWVLRLFMTLSRTAVKTYNNKTYLHENLKNKNKWKGENQIMSNVLDQIIQDWFGLSQEVALDQLATSRDLGFPTQQKQKMRKKIQVSWLRNSSHTSPLFPLFPSSSWTEVLKNYKLLDSHLSHGSSNDLSITTVKWDKKVLREESNWLEIT